jgi:hypothetical protein
MKKLIVLMLALACFASCEKKEDPKEDPKSAACDITGFTVNGTAWNIDGTNITYTYPAGTPETALTPAITVSRGATVTPASGAAQNFFTTQGVTYTVTAEDGKTTKTYTAKATVAPHSSCDITAFTVNGAAWSINGTNITHTYPEGTAATTLTPTITVSAGATVTPASGVAQDFFTGAGVTYTVTAEDGTTKKTYTTKALIQTQSVVASGITGACTWTLTGTSPNYILTISGNGAMGNYTSSTNTPWYSRRSYITTVVIQDGVTAIGDRAFSGCTGLTSVTIGNSVTTVGNNAFNGCTGLTAVTIPNSVKTIGELAFRDCTGLSTVNINSSVETTGDWAFFGCTSFTVNFGNSVETIGEYAFRECSGLTAVIIPNSVKTIGAGAFVSCTGLTAVTIPNSVETIGNSAFSGCSKLTSVTIGSAVKTIGASAFYNCSGLTTVTIPNAVETIGESAFRNCSGLTAVTIGSAVKTIGEYTFAGCSKLRTVTNYRTSPQTISSTVFENDTLLNGRLNVLSSAVNSYKNVPVWTNFKTITGI